MANNNFEILTGLQIPNTLLCSNGQTNVTGNLVVSNCFSAAVVNVGTIFSVNTTAVSQPFANSVQLLQANSTLPITGNSVIQAGAPVSVAYSSSLTLPMSNAINYVVTNLNGALSINFTNVIPGMSGFVWLNPANGGVNISGNTLTVTANGNTAFYPTANPLATTGTAPDLFSYLIVNTSVVLVNMIKNIA